MAWRRKNKWTPYRSGLEKGIADNLKELNVRFEYEGKHLQFGKRVNRGVCDACGGNKVHQLRTYTPDFEIWCDGGRSFLVESKGNFTQSDRAKMLAVKASNPDLDIRLLFAANNKLRKGKDERYSDWATKHGFTFHIGRTVPISWLQPSPDLHLREQDAPRPASSDLHGGRKKSRSRRGSVRR